MAFKAGAIYGEAKLDNRQWKSGLKSLVSLAKKAALAAGAIFVAFMAMATKKANEFQKAMSNVATVADTSTVSMAGLTKSVLKLNPELGSTIELTKGLYQAFSAGAGTAERAMAITTESAMFAKAGLTDMASAVDIITSAINAYGKENMTAKKASDLFFQTIKYGKITGAELSQTVGMSIPLFSAAGIKMEELAAAIAAQTKMGVKAQTTTMQLNNIIKAFLTPSEGMIKALREIGYESGSTFLKAEGLAGALEMIEDATQGDVAAIADLLPNIRGMRGVMALTGRGGREFTNILREMENATGATREAFDKQEKTWATLRNSLQQVQIIIGNVAKHFVDKIAVAATTAAKAIKEFLLSTEGMEMFATIAGYVAGGFAIIREVVQPIIDTIGDELAEIWKTLSEGMEDLFGNVDKSNIAFTILSGAVKLAIGVFSVLGKIVNHVVRTVVDLAKVIKEVGILIGDFMLALINPLHWVQFGKQLAKTGDSFVDLGKGFVDSVGAIFKEAWEQIKGFVKETGEFAEELEGKIKITYKSAYEYVENLFEKLITGQDKFERKSISFWDRAKKVYDQMLNMMSKSTKTALSDLENTWKDYFDQIAGGFRYLYDSLGAISSQHYTNEEAKLQNAQNAELAALQKQLDDEIITEEEFETEKEKIDTKYREKFNELAEEKFNADKLNKIADIWMNVAAAIAGWWAVAPQLGPIAGYLFAGGMTAASIAMGAKQSILVNEQEFVPSMQYGGKISGYARVNEVGGEIIRLPDNSVVIPHDISRQIAEHVKSGNIIHVSFAGANISDNISLDRIVSAVIRKLGKQMRLAG